MTRIEREIVRPPAELLACKPEPRRPDLDDIQWAELEDWIVDLAMAGRECRERLDRVRGFVDEVSTPKP